MAANDTTFAGSIPALYDRYLGPLLFEPYAEDLALRLADLTSGALLETASGTGIVTQALLRRLPVAVGVTATDLNQAMVDFAAGKAGMARATLRQADALALPFPADHFDAVVCQFGAMFFPDRVAGYREARRVLKPGGRLAFNIWDGIAHNAAAQCVTDALAARFPDDPPRFMARTPHGHHDTGVIRRELAEAGFDRITLETVSHTSRAASPREPAIGYCQGTPLRGEIEARAPQGLSAATDAVEAALAARFGTGPFAAPMQAHVIVAVK
ncbi:MAG: class I SAM-dependent methyltransferase [Reyranella sp.]|nr:class I SAM-dependent methyltransferase [Reyranella sp.]